MRIEEEYSCEGYFQGRIKFLTIIYQEAIINLTRDIIEIKKKVSSKGKVKSRLRFIPVAPYKPTGYVLNNKEQKLRSYLELLGISVDGYIPFYYKSIKDCSITERYFIINGKIGKARYSFKFEPRENKKEMISTLNQIIKGRISKRNLTWKDRIS